MHMVHTMNRYQFTQNGSEIQQFILKWMYSNRIQYHNPNRYLVLSTAEVILYWRNKYTAMWM